MTIINDDIIEFNGKQYQILYGKVPEINDLVYVFKHNHKDCIGVWKVTKVRPDDNYTYFDVNGEEGSTFRERLFVVKELTKE